MKLDVHDVQTITSYIKSNNPDYNGPVFIDLSRLETLHMSNSIAIVHLTLCAIKYFGVRK